MCCIESIDVNRETSVLELFSTMRKKGTLSLINSGTPSVLSVSEERYFRIISVLRYETLVETTLCQQAKIQSTQILNTYSTLVNAEYNKFLVLPRFTGPN